MSVDQADNIGVRYGLATAIARLFAPVPLGVALLVFVGERSAARPLAGAGWGLFAAVWAAALPYWLTHRLRANRPGGGHASRWRVLYLAVALLSAVTGIVLLTVLGAPPQVAAATATMVVGLLASLVVNTKWAISNHTAAAGGGAVILSAMVSPVCFVVLGPLVAAVAWARVALRMHTWAQAVAGIALGAAVAAGIFPLLAQ